jgi:cell division protein FtsZ
VTGGEDFSLTEYEEIINLITERADPEALVIPGIVTDPSLGDEVRVTVIATGFNRITRPEAPGRESSRKGFEDYLSSEEWKRITETPTQRGMQYLLGRNDDEDELDIPTVLRDRRMAGEKSEA